MCTLREHIFAFQQDWASPMKQALQQTFWKGDLRKLGILCDITKEWRRRSSGKVWDKLLICTGLHRADICDSLSGEPAIIFRIAGKMLARQLAYITYVRGSMSTLQILLFPYFYSLWSPTLSREEPLFLKPANAALSISFRQSTLFGLTQATC